MELEIGEVLNKCVNLCVYYSRFRLRMLLALTGDSLVNKVDVLVFIA